MSNNKLNVPREIWLHTNTDDNKLWGLFSKPIDGTDIRFIRADIVEKERKADEALIPIDDCDLKDDGVTILTETDMNLLVHHQKTEELLDKTAEKFREFIKADWMMSHDWGGDRDVLIAESEAVLAEFNKFKEGK